MTLTEHKIEQGLTQRLVGLKYTYRPDIRDRASLEQKFLQKLEALKMVSLTDAEFAHLRDAIVTSVVFAAAKTLRTRNTHFVKDMRKLAFSLQKYCGKMALSLARHIFIVPIK